MFFFIDDAESGEGENTSTSEFWESSKRSDSSSNLVGFYDIFATS